MITFVPTRRALLAGLAVICPWPVAVRAQGAMLTPEQFGARGDGRTDDTDAFQRLSAAASDKVGIVIALKPQATYRVGRQLRGPDGTIVTETILTVRGSSNVRLRGNGATLKLNDGLRYGSFDPATGNRFDPPKGKFTKPSFAASIGSLILIEASSGVQIDTVTLDGNMDRLNVGGHWGDRGIQLHADGLRLLDVSNVTVANVTARNNGLDGIYLRGKGRAEQSARDDIRLLGVRCDRNGRQGLSIVGGCGISVENSIFSNTAQGPIGSAPSAGVDIEPNGRAWATRLSFVGCTFVNNLGVGLLADQGAASGIDVRQCTFWQGFAARSGVTKRSGDAFWLKKPGVRLTGCVVHGTVTNLDTGALVTGTSFDDAVHERFGRAAQTRPYLLANVGGTFDDCRFVMTGNRKGLVYATKPVIFRDCLFHIAGHGLTPNFAPAFLGSAATLEDVRFTEALLAGNQRFYIYDGKPQLKGTVEVQGPHVRWGSRNGPIGNIAALRSARSTRAGSAPGS